MDTLTQQDRDHLRMLALMHYIFAGLGLLGIAFLGMHYMMMRTFMRPEFMQHESHPPPAEFFQIFLWIYGVMGLFIVVGMTLNVLAARWLKARRNRMFCIVVAALDCLQVPLGTALGVFTIVVLMRDSVRQAFDKSPGASGSADAPDV